MPNFEPLSIVHIEDSDADALIVEMVLKKTSLAISEFSRFSSLEEGIVFLDGAKVDLVLLDLFLPDSQGVETLKRLRQHFPNLAVIVVTGANEEHTGLLAVKYGAQDYLTKDEINANIVHRAIRYSIERHSYDQHVVELANIDLLTGLPNRTRFMEYLSNVIALSKRMRSDLSLLFIDCDNFKRVNDTHGHIRGDEYLIHIGQTIRRVIRSTDFAARLGGDEFVVAYQSNGLCSGSALTLAEKILSELKNQILLPCAESFEVRCSVGVTSYDGSHPQPMPDRMIYEADTAMYLSKQRGGDCISFFDQALEEKANRRVKLLQLLSQAKADQDFSLAYQPIMHTQSGEVAGLETLLRWKHPDGENVSPAEFVPLLEETGFIQEVGAWVIKKALEDFEELLKHKYVNSDTWISLNVSPVQLYSTDFVRDIAYTVHHTLLEPEQVHLEITEGVFIEKSETVLKTLFRVTAIGCKWSIDDFGVGYSSMSYLKDLPIHTIKIDKSFIDGICENTRDIAIVRAINALAQTIGMRVVCEGVESKEQYQLLCDETVDYVQGYYFYKPIDFDVLKAQLNSTVRQVIPFRQ